MCNNNLADNHALRELARYSCTLDAFCLYLVDKITGDTVIKGHPFFINGAISSAANVHAFEQALQIDYQHFLGFPAALDYDLLDLGSLNQKFLNNVGDPYADAFHGAHSKMFEREVVSFIAELFHAPADDFWGYVTNGSTECNLFALYLARQKYPDAIVYYSEAAHYSIAKNVHILAMEGVKIKSVPSGEMDYENLQTQVVKHADKPAIVVATIGTTMTEAKDDVAAIIHVLDAAGITDRFIHSDAALAGVYTALLTPEHPFDFRAGADSVSISGHKFIGSPIPCGVIITRKQDKERLQAASNYTGSPDSTISGSRNGHTPLMLWHAIQRFGRHGFIERARAGQKLAAYAHRRLAEIGWRAWRNPGALTVVFTTPPAPLAQKWQLASTDGWSHLICMPGITQQKLDEFLADMATAAL